jgi:hypothetical protein
MRIHIALLFEQDVVRRLSQRCRPTSYAACVQILQGPLETHDDSV